ncbi:hypothetical protein [Stieleria mannarensis]|uniref:hypothetical protein n=1 Tax=Stieleria mannarensis TaxID=2755585 RepID=UPI001603697C|nr:hypothetical protein [Rhodopirellula sp. JC639]
MPCCLPDPDRNSWSKIDLTITRDDGVVVDVQLLRPDQWILENNVFVGSAIPIHVQELDVHGTATVNALSACPELALGRLDCITDGFSCFCSVRHQRTRRSVRQRRWTA